MYLSTKEIAQRWGISDRRVRILCDEGKIKGAFKEGRSWKIPKNAQKPMDNRIKISDNIPKEFESVFTRIENKKAEMNKRRPLTKGEVDRLRQEFLVEFTYNSNAIEGNTLTLRETEAIIKDDVVIEGKTLKEHLEVIGHKQTYDYVLSLAQDKTPFSERIIKETHSLVLTDKPEGKGVYRRIPVKIADSLHTPVKPLEIQNSMKMLTDELKQMQNMHTVERAALFHLKFESIHPFVDGNGRCGRLLLNFDLIRNGYPNINIKFTDRQRYYDCFNDYHLRSSHSKMTNLVAVYVEEMLDKYLDILL